MMPHLDVSAVILLVLGSFLTIVGGLATTYFTLHITNKTAKKTLVHVKIEEIYELTSQVRDWAETWLLRISQATGVHPFSCLADLSRPVFSHEDNDNLHFWTLMTNPREDTCPIDKIVTLISLYVPSLKEQAKQYQWCVFYIENNLAMSMVLDKLIEGKTPVNVEPAVEEKVEKLVDEIISLDKAATIREAFDDFRKMHIALQLSLEKVIAHG